MFPRRGQRARPAFCAPFYSHSTTGFEPTIVLGSKWPPHLPHAKLSVHTLLSENALGHSGLERKKIWEPLSS